MADPAQRDLRSPAMRQLVEQITAQQRRLAWNDSKLCEFATQVLAPRDPYRRLKVSSTEFLGRLRVPHLTVLRDALTSAR